MSLSAASRKVCIEATCGNILQALGVEYFVPPEFSLDFACRTKLTENGELIDTKIT
jgi:hypothetical protein